MSERKNKRSGAASMSRYRVCHAIWMIGEQRRGVQHDSLHTDAANCGERPQCWPSGRLAQEASGEVRITCDDGYSHLRSNHFSFQPPDGDATYMKGLELGLDHTAIPDHDDCERRRVDVPCRNALHIRLRDPVDLLHV